jgi:signal transduction histidine kinase
MGLAICRKVVERHGGEITASSSPEGSKFVVTLPSGQHGDAEPTPVAP